MFLFKVKPLDKLYVEVKRKNEDDPEVRVAAPALSNLSRILPLSPGPCFPSHTLPLSPLKADETEVCVCVTVGADGYTLNQLRCLTRLANRSARVCSGQRACAVARKAEPHEPL